MFKKNWQYTADILRNNNPGLHNNYECNVWTTIREDFANLFEEESDKFNRAKFVEACNSI